MNLSFNDLPTAVEGLYSKLESIEKLLAQKNESFNSDELLTVEGAASFLSLAKPTIYGYVHRCEIPFMKKGKKLYFSREDLMVWMESSKVQTSTEIKERAKQGLIDVQKKS